MYKIFINIEYIVILTLANQWLQTMSENEIFVVAIINGSLNANLKVKKVL